MSHEPDNHDPKKPQRKRDKFKSGVRNLFHRDSSHQDKAPATSTAPSQPKPDNRTPTPTPPDHATPSASQPHNPTPLSSAAFSQAIKDTRVQPTQPKPETVLDRYPRLTYMLNGALGGLAIAADSTNVPGLKAAAAAIQGLMKFAEGVGEHRGQIADLLEEAAAYADGLIQILEIRPAEGSGTETDSVFAELVTKLMEELNLATETMNKITAKNESLCIELWNQGEITGEVKKRASALHKAHQRFTGLITALNSVNDQHILRISKEMLGMIQELVLTQSKWDTSNLSYIKAAYDQDAAVRVCYDNTRAAILDDIHSRLSLDLRIVWLRALAGSGKSTIAKKVADYLDRNRILAGSFFFSRNISERSGMENLFATLASQLAVRDVMFAAELAKVLAANPELRHAEPAKQLEELLLKPLSLLPPSLTASRPHVFVLDALDECGTDQGRSLVKFLLSHITKFPVSYHFFVTSRPEAPIVDQMFSSDNLPIQTINIDEGHEETSRKDISAYLLAELQRVKGLNVTDEEIEMLTELANGLFQFAATVVLMITDPHQYQSPRETLNTILNIGGDGSASLLERVALDNLYGTIFQSAYLRPTRRNQTKAYDTLVARYHLTVGGIIHAREPVSIRMLAALVRLPEDEVRFALQRLSSVILLPDPGDLNTPIRIRHLTFTEYITNAASDLARDHAELVIDDRTETDLAVGAFSIMLEGLHFNISNSKSSFLPNSAYPPYHFEEAILHPLAYACRFWASHLENTQHNSVSDQSHLMAFMKEKLLFWLEALSALGAVNIARSALTSLDVWLLSIDSENDARMTQTKLLVKDAIKFVECFAPVIAQSAPHTYISPLAFAPTSSPVAKLYASRFKNIPSLAIGQLLSWPARQLVLHGHSWSVSSVAFSPDGKHVVSGSRDKTIRMWDVETGQTVAGPFQGHSREVTSVAFSPDRKHVVSGSHDKTIQMWDVETGQTVAGPFEGHSDLVSSVAFSPDGKHVVSGSWDKTIRMWDVETGETVAGSFEGHSDSVTSVAFSPDGKHVVSGSWDNIIRMWDVETGETVAGPFEDHSDSVTSVAFSPDGKHVVSGSGDKTIRMWDVETGETAAGPFQGHSSGVSSVAFSPDGKHVVFGSWDKTIRMWDVETGQTVAGPFEGHSDSVTSVAFSPDGKHVVSGSDDKTIRIRDLNGSYYLPLAGNQTTFHSDGWVKGPDNQLLLWVPPLHRQSFHLPYTVKVMGPHETCVEYGEVAWGTEWTRCYSGPV